MTNSFHKVMIVDDSEDDRWIFKKNMQKAGFAEEIIEASTGAEALDLLTATGLADLPFPELIFLDVNMPVVNGFEFLDAFNSLSREYTSRCSIIMTCSVDDAAEQKRALEYSNVIGYYLKPLSLELLLFLKEQIRHTNAS